jgi:CHAD domain-containing protein
MAKSPYDIAPDASFAEAAHTAIHKQLNMLLDNLPGTRAGDDIEALHDMRVASRRLRAALSVFVDAYPAKQFVPLEKQVARVTDALGAVRDADVLIEFMQEASDQAPESQRVGLTAFIDHLKAGRDAERVHLVKALDLLEKSRFRKDFHAMLEKAAAQGGDTHG